MIDSTAIDDQKEWEDILFEETLEEIGMGTRITAGVVLGILAGAGINASGVLGYFDNPYHRYEFLGATGAALGYMGRRILDWAGEELASRAAKEARALTDEVQEAVAEGFANDRNFVALLKNLHDLSAKVEEIKGKRGKKFQAIRAAKKQAGLELKGYVSERAKTLVPPELQQKGVTFSAQRAADMAKDRIGENKMKFSKSEIKQIIKEEIQQYMDEIIDNNGVEIEEEGPSDEEHLLGLLAKEFDRIPSDRRKSVYTRFLSAANRYADKVSVAAPESIPSLQEELTKEANIGTDFQNFLSSLGKVPQKKQKQLLQQLNNVVEKYVSNLEGGGGPVPTVSTDVDLDESFILEELTKEANIGSDFQVKALLNAVNNYVDRMEKSGVALGGPIQREHLEAAINEAFKGTVIEEITKAQIERAIKNLLVGAGIAAALAGPGAAKAADAVTQQFAQQQQSQQYKGYQPGGSEKFQFGNASTTAQTKGSKKQGVVSFKETENAYLVTVKETQPNKEDLVVNKLKREKVPVPDSLAVKKFMIKKGGKLDKSGKFRTFSFPKSVSK